MNKTNMTVNWPYSRSSAVAPCAAECKVIDASSKWKRGGGLKRLIVNDEAAAGIAMIFQAVARGEVHHLLVHSPDRLSREPRKLNGILRRLGASGVRVHYTNHDVSRLPYGFKALGRAKSGPAA